MNYHSAPIPDHTHKFSRYLWTNSYSVFILHCGCYLMIFSSVCTDKSYSVFSMKGYYQNIWILYQAGISLLRDTENGHSLEPIENCRQHSVHYSLVKIYFIKKCFNYFEWINTTFRFIHGKHTCQLRENLKRFSLFFIITFLEFCYFWGWSFQILVFLWFSFFSL